MKKLLIAAAVAVLGATCAQSADMAPIYRKAAPVQTFTWTGSYIGGYAGGATGAGDLTTTDPRTATGVNFGLGNAASYRFGSSFIGGYTDGYNWQVSPNWVIGYESETGYINVKGGANFNLPGASEVATTSVNGIYSAWTARAGYAWDRSLLYVKGGVALAKFETGVTNAAPVHVDTTTRKYALGYAVGAGWEYALDNKWSVKAEYLYLGFDKDIGTTGNAVPPNAQVFSTTSLAGIHTGKVGLNYRFDWFGLLR